MADPDPTDPTGTAGAPGGIVELDDPGDPRLADYRDLRDVELRRRIGVGAREAYDRDFRPDVSVGRIAGVLDEVRAAPARARAYR